MGLAEPRRAEEQQVGALSGGKVLREAAADPRLIPLLLSFGLEEFSVSPNAVLETRRQIARWSKADADAIAAEVMAQETTQDVQVALARLMEV